MGAYPSSRRQQQQILHLQSLQRQKNLTDISNECIYNDGAAVGGASGNKTRGAASNLFKSQAKSLRK